MQKGCNHSILLLLSCQVMSDSLRPRGLQHTRLLCSSPSPRVCTSSWPLHRGCRPTISSSVSLFSFCLQSFPASLFLLLFHSLNYSLQHLNSIFERKSSRDCRGWSCMGSILVDHFKPLCKVLLLPCAPTDERNNSSVYKEKEEHLPDAWFLISFKIFVFCFGCEPFFKSLLSLLQQYCFCLMLWFLDPPACS